jgi:hypothetical protein
MAGSGTNSTTNFRSLLTGAIWQWLSRIASEAAALAGSLQVRASHGRIVPGCQHRPIKIADIRRRI